MLSPRAPVMTDASRLSSQVRDSMLGLLNQMNFGLVFPPENTLSHVGSSMGALSASPITADKSRELTNATVGVMDPYAEGVVFQAGGSSSGIPPTVAVMGGQSDIVSGDATNQILEISKVDLGRFLGFPNLDAAKTIKDNVNEGNLAKSMGDNTRTDSKRSSRKRRRWLGYEKCPVIPENQKAHESSQPIPAESTQVANQGPS
ncbi:hypothetical protein NE237_032029 [Protea cynaroides]|uniref:Uncharacterized protein n=1 Tax=Protea cynaroides TaxID=273540 RepID=A0A9Q0R330_9MAGN|nr:hypothetical protein NE237_032029 [Protea cynaroides]